MILMRPKNLILTIALLVTIAWQPPAAVANSPRYEIKFATLAPEGSTWMTIMREMDEEVREATNGEVGFRIYPGGVQGDEPDVIRKMRFNQIHAAGFTGVGLGEILPEFRVLEVPFLFRNKAEIDYITNRFYDHFDRRFREQGYALLGFAEVGYVYLFSTQPVNEFHDLQSMKVWAWQGDPLAEALFAALGVTPLSVALPEVFTGLQTGMLDAVYASPLAAVSMQWHTRVRYMNQYPLTNSNGAVLISLRLFERIPEEYRSQVIEISRRHLRELTLRSREDNRESIDVMQRSGVTLLPGPDAEEQAWLQDVGMELREELTGELFSQELLDQVIAALEEYRANHPESE